MTGPPRFKAVNPPGRQTTGRAPSPKGARAVSTEEQDARGPRPCGMEGPSGARTWGGAAGRPPAGRERTRREPSTPCGAQRPRRSWRHRVR